MKDASASDTNAAGRARRYLKNAAERAWSAAAGIFPAPDDPYDPILRTTAGLMKTLLQADDGVISEAEIAVFQEIFRSRYNSRQVELLTRLLRQCDPVSPEQAAKLHAAAQFAYDNLVDDLAPKAEDGCKDCESPECDDGACGISISGGNKILNYWHKCLVDFLAP